MKSDFIGILSLLMLLASCKSDVEKCDFDGQWCAVTSYEASNQTRQVNVTNYSDSQLLEFYNDSIKGNEIVVSQGTTIDLTDSRIESYDISNSCKTLEINRISGVISIYDIILKDDDFLLVERDNFKSILKRK